MKKVTSILISCVLIIAFKFHTTSFAMSHDDIESDEVFMTQKKNCQSVFPALSNKLEEWAKHHQISLKLRELLDNHRYDEVALCMESAKKMDELYPDILKLSSTLINSLTTLQSTYKNIPDEDMLTLVGIKDQYKSITNNLSTFIDASSFEQQLQTTASKSEMK